MVLTTVQEIAAALPSLQRAILVQTGRYPAADLYAAWNL